MKRNRTKRFLALFLALVMSIAMILPVMADDINADQEVATLTYDAPTSPITVDDSIITATAHRAASPVLGMMGLNATSGFGMINGGAPQSLADAETRFALGVWGTDANSNPDPYYWNYFYNFYAKENGLAISDDALINANVAASPVAADNNLVEEYGNVSYSLYTRPEIVIGVAGSGNGSDTTGYDSQLATIHSFTSDSPYYQEGDETYSPVLVSYQTTTIKQMIESVYRIADAVNEVKTADPTKKTRYEDVATADELAAKYESYVYGAISYVQAQLAKEGKSEKTVAVLTAINDDGTYTLADSLSTSATSLVRAWEYASGVSANYLEVLGKTSSDAVTKEELLAADAIITINNQNITEDSLKASFGDDDYTGILVTSTPAAMYGMTMNSVENAMGYAYIIGCLYSEYIDPVEWCAYFYETFLHVTDQAAIQKCVRINFASVVLPSGVTVTLSDYSAAKIEAAIAEGRAFYNASPAAFSAEVKDGFYEYNGLTAWGTHQPAEEAYVIVAVDDKEVAVNVSEIIEAADEITIDRVGRNNTTSVTAKFASVADIIAAADIDVPDDYLGVIVTASDDFTANILAEENPYLYIEDGALRSAVAGSAGNKWVRNTVKLQVVENFFDVINGVTVSNGVNTAINWAVDNGITAGYDDNTFAPTASVTRAEMAVFLYRVAGRPAVAADQAVAFTDVIKGDTVSNGAYKAIQWAVANGITKGYSDGTFRPDEAVSRQEIAIFLYRLAGKPSVSGTASFTDIAEVSSGAAKAITWASNAGIVRGFSGERAGEFGPTESATRGQMAVMLMRFAR